MFPNRKEMILWGMLLSKLLPDSSQDILFCTDNMETNVYINKTPARGLFSLNSQMISEDSSSFDPPQSSSTSPLQS